MNKSLFRIRSSPQYLKINLLNKDRFSLNNSQKVKIKFNKKNQNLKKFKKQKFKMKHHNNNVKNLKKGITRLNNLNRGYRHKFLIILLNKRFSKRLISPKL